MNSSITSLEYSSSIPYSAILPSLVQLSQNLKSLALAIPGGEGYSAITFNRLENLRLKVESESGSSLSNWHIPNLRRLWLDAEPHLNPHTKETITNALIDSYGATLTFLQLSHRQLHLEQLLDRCPVLEHIASPHHLPDSLTHQRLKFVDVFVSCEHTDPSELITALMVGFPALRSYRCLDFGNSLFQDVPLPFANESGQDDEGARAEDDDSTTSRTHDGDRNEEREGPASMSRLRGVERYEGPQYLPAILGFVDSGAVHGMPVLWTDQSQDYVFSSGEDDGGSIDGLESDDAETDSDSDSDAVTVSEDGGYLKDELQVEEPWEIGHDEAIEMFYRTRAD